LFEKIIGTQIHPVRCLLSNRVNADGQDIKDLNLEARRQGQKPGQKSLYFEIV
jgi:hypothetical protein